MLLHFGKIQQSLNCLLFQSGVLFSVLSVLWCESNARDWLKWNEEIDARSWTPNRYRDNDSFDFYVFTQQWASSVCIDANISHEHECKYPDNVTTWTIHGLWPTKKGSLGPNNCNSTLKFNATTLQPIRDQLLKYWPNEYTDTAINDFWEHEWTKHGTCAQHVPELNSELKYFNFTLGLNRKHDLLTLLGQQGLKPRRDYVYQYNEMLSAVTKAVGRRPNIQCTYDKVTKTQYLTQIELCVDKSYGLIDCVDSAAVRSGPRAEYSSIVTCSSLDMVGYLPLH